MAGHVSSMLVVCCAKLLVKIHLFLWGLFSKMIQRILEILVMKWMNCLTSGFRTTWLQKKKNTPVLAVFYYLDDVITDDDGYIPQTCPCRVRILLPPDPRNYRLRALSFKEQKRLYEKEQVHQDMSGADVVERINSTTTKLLPLEFCLTGRRISECWPRIRWWLEVSSLPFHELMCCWEYTRWRIGGYLQQE